LGPSGMGVIAVLMIVGDFANLLSEAGLSEAAIQHKTVTREQQSTLYWLNLGFGIIVSLSILAAAPLLARMFGFKELSELVPITSLAIILMAAGTQIQS